MNQSHTKSWLGEYEVMIKSQSDLAKLENKKEKDRIVPKVVRLLSLGICVITNLNSNT